MNDSSAGATSAPTRAAPSAAQRPADSSGPLERVALVAAVALLYAASGWAGLQLPYYGPSVTLVWPPVGIAIAAVMRFGPWVAPGIAVGAFAVNALVGPSLAAALGIAVGNTLGPTIAGTLLTRWLEVRPQLDRFRDVAAFVGVGALGCSIVTATGGVLSLVGGGLAQPAHLGVAWLAWLAGDATGALVVGSALLVWSVDAAPLSGPRPRIEKLLLAGAWLLVTFLNVAYGRGMPPLKYLYYPVGLWSAMRFGTRGSSAAALFTAVVIVPCTAAGVGPFVEPEGIYSGMLGMWAFATALPATGLFLGAVLLERDHVLAHKDRLMHELDHRVKNTLALLSSIAEQSGAAASDVDAFVDTFVRRVRALARSHEALARSHWQGVGLAEMIDEITRPYVFDGGGCIEARGPDCRLSVHCAAPVAMILHELATNAAKHGAWRQSAGMVRVAWNVSGDGDLHLVWGESGAAPTPPLAAKGYGLTIVSGFVEYELGGRVGLDLGARGLVCTLDLPSVGAVPD